MHTPSILAGMIARGECDSATYSVIELAIIKTGKLYDELMRQGYLD
jgi:hypothetical protein